MKQNILWWDPKTYNGICVVTIGDRELSFNFFFRLLNHHSSKRCNTLQLKIIVGIIFIKKLILMNNSFFSIITWEISKHGSFPTWAPVKPYTEFALSFKATCLPSKIFFLNGSVSLKIKINWIVIYKRNNNLFFI